MAFKYDVWPFFFEHSRTWVLRSVATNQGHQRWRVVHCLNFVSRALFTGGPDVWNLRLFLVQFEFGHRILL